MRCIVLLIDARGFVTVCFGGATAEMVSQGLPCIRKNCERLIETPAGTSGAIKAPSMYIQFTECKLSAIRLAA